MKYFGLVNPRRGREAHVLLPKEAPRKPQDSPGSPRKHPGGPQEAPVGRLDCKSTAIESPGDTGRSGRPGRAGRKCLPSHPENR